MVEDLAAGVETEGRAAAKHDRHAGRGADHPQRLAPRRAGNGRVAGRADAADRNCASSRRSSTALDDEGDRGADRGGIRAPRAWRRRRISSSRPAPPSRNRRSRVATLRQEERAAQTALAQIARQVEDATREMTRLQRAGAGRPRSPREAARGDEERRDGPARSRGAHARNCRRSSTNWPRRRKRRTTRSPSRGSSWPRRRSSARPGSSSASRWPIACRNCASWSSCARANRASTSSASSTRRRKSPRPSASTPRRARR